MKQVIIIVIATCILNVQYAFGDIIPENTHYVDKCVIITNISDYADLTLLGYIKNMGSEHEGTYVITSSDCLTKGYKFNSLYVYAVSSDYIADKDIDTIDLPNDGKALMSSIILEPYAGYYHDSIPFDKIEEYYKILGFTESSMVLFKWKEVFGFMNGSVDSVKTYDYSGDISSLYQNIPSSSVNIGSISSISLYPNPAEKYIRAEINNSYVGDVSIQLISSNGKILFNSELEKNSEQMINEISVANYSKGIYFIHVIFSDIIETKRIVIR